MMNERKRRILQAITDDYIVSAEPVGSRTIARKYDLGVSPATIRNEMADLEESGYLQQPHTSAGRVPSDKGYRFYVDVLMHPEEISRVEREQLRREVAANQREMEALVHQIARLLALHTRYTSVVVAPRLAESVVRHLKFVMLDALHVLVVLVTESGFVVHRLVELDAPVGADDLLRLGRVVSDRLRGSTIGDVTSTMIGALRSEATERTGRDQLVEAVLDLVSDGRANRTHERVFLEGAINIFDHPEFRDVERARSLLTLLEEREALFGMLSRAADRTGMQVTIGREHRHQEMHDCSMVTATYTVNGHVIGSVGVLGPTRMEYARVVSMVEYAARSLSEALTGLARRSSG